MPFDKFCKVLGDIGSNKGEILRAAYKNALRRKGMTTLNYINYYQKNEPHFKNANFNK
jgi:hypothetical protein